MSTVSSNNFRILLDTVAKPFITGYSLLPGKKIELEFFLEPGNKSILITPPTSIVIEHLAADNVTAEFTITGVTVFEEAVYSTNIENRFGRGLKVKAKFNTSSLLFS